MGTPIAGCFMEILYKWTMTGGPLFMETPMLRKNNNKNIVFPGTKKQKNRFLNNFINLVGGFNPSEKYEFVSCDDEIPNIWKTN